MTTLHVPMHELPGAIRESVRAALNAHGVRFLSPLGRELTAAEVEQLFAEAGRNAAQAIVGLDSRQDDATCDGGTP